MATFSWSDNLKIAFRSCSPCLWPLQDDDESLRQDEGNNRGPGVNTRLSLSRSEELHGLLANADSTDTDAERMSLHSNPGRGSSSQRKKKRRSRKKTSSSSSNIDGDNGNRRRIITLFGYNLFGRRPPPIQLAGDSEDALYSRRGGGSMTPNTLNHSTGSSTFDSDAAPLDTDTIAALSSPTTAAAVIKAAAQSSAEVEAQRLKEKEDRRRKRKEKKELKRMAELLVQQGVVGDGEEFEGFQGSGSENPASTQSTYPHMPAGVLSVSDSGSVQREKSIPGAVSAPPHNDDDDDDDKADFDGSHYARNIPSGSNRGSDDSRSRTSTSLSDRMHRTPVADSRQKRPKDKRSSSRTTKSSSSNTSQLPSPRQMVSPSTVEQGQGFFDLEDVDAPVDKADAGYLPITGFGGTPASSRMASNLGAMFAQRGGDDASIRD